jgi:hypothetical protein
VQMSQPISDRPLHLSSAAVDFAWYHYIPLDAVAVVMLISVISCLMLHVFSQKG